MPRPVQATAQLIGVKVLAWDRRDPTRPENVQALQAALKGGKEVAQAMQAVIDEVGGRLAARALKKPRESLTEDELQTFLENELGAKQHAATLKNLTEDDLAAIDALLVERLAPVLRASARSRSTASRRSSRPRSWRSPIRRNYATGTPGRRRARLARHLRLRSRQSYEPVRQRRAVAREPAARRCHIRRDESASRRSFS